MFLPEGLIPERTLKWRIRALTATPWRRVWRAGSHHNKRNRVIHDYPGNLGLFVWFFRQYKMVYIFQMQTDNFNLSYKNNIIKIINKYLTAQRFNGTTAQRQNREMAQLSRYAIALILLPPSPHTSSPHF